MSCVSCCILVIACETFPVYRTFKAVWRKYARTCPGIDVFFVHGAPSEPVPDEMPDEIRVSKVCESYIPGICLKTVAALERILPKRYDFVLRSNLSSFFNFRLLQSLLGCLPRARCYAGSPGNAGFVKFASGCCFVMSRDVATAVVERKSELQIHLPDDWAFADFIVNKLGVPLIEFPALNAVQATVSSLPLVLRRLETEPKQFHYRIRNEPNREETDVAIAQKLLQVHYGLE